MRLPCCRCCCCTVTWWLRRDDALHTWTRAHSRWKRMVWVFTLIAVAATVVAFPLAITSTTTFGQVCDI
jgi:hypothetical protein